MNQIKAILWDIDGVIIPTKKYASDIAIESFNLSASKVKFFFDNIWSSCLINECRLEDCLNIMLEGSDFEKKELEYIDFWFKTESRIDYELLNFIQKVSPSVMQVIASNQEMQRTLYLWNQLCLKDNFDYIFTSSILGIAKPHKEYFFKILHELNLKKENIIFIDNDKNNILAAKNVGIKSILYQSIKDLDELKTLFI